MVRVDAMKVKEQVRLRQSYCRMLCGEWQGDVPEDLNFWYMMCADGVFLCILDKLDEQQRARIPAEAMKGMDKRMRQASALRMKHAMSQILREVNAARIPVIVMRGQMLAEGLYAAPDLRPFTDFDLLYDEQHSLMLKQTLGNHLGYAPPEKFPNLFKKGDLVIDLHTEPLGIERIQSWAGLTPLRAPDFFKYAEEGELAGEKALLVHPRVNLPYLCFHALKHSFGRLVWLYDIALLANQVSADGLWDEVLQGIEEYRLQRPCYYALSHVKQHLGASVPEDILAAIKPEMGFVEQRLFRRHMNHEVIPYLAERLFARMLPDFKHRMEFWRETIYPRYEVRAQIAGGGCVKCSFIRKRLKQLVKAGWLFIKEGVSLVRA